MNENYKPILYNKLDEPSKTEVDKKIIELKTKDPPLTLKDIISIIKEEMGVIIKQYHIYQALKKNISLIGKPIHEEEEIQIEEEEKPFSIEVLKEIISSITRKIKFSFDGKKVMFYLVRLSEIKKYGSKKYEKVDENMELCLTATYSLIDNLMFPSSTTIEGKGKLTKKEKEEGLEEKIVEKFIPSGIKKATIRIDSDGNFVHKNDIIEVDLEGKPLPIVPSSLHLKDNPNEIELKDTIDINQVLDHDINSHYILFPTEGENDAELKNILESLENSIPSKFYLFQFNYYPSTTPQSSFLQLIEESGKKFMLLSAGIKHETEFVGLDEFPKEILEIDEDIELDFNI